jgi:RHH-type proline utilization regulon transcriptional repressor/proline dehydrogenase/delta 1-pyrroline-5-carboxylate dehydrogenase
VQRIEREQIAEQAVALVQHWLEESKRQSARSPAEKRLAKILKDPQGLEWTLRFVDRVIRPTDKTVAAIELNKLAKDLPKSLGLIDRATIQLGGLVAIPFRAIVIPIAKTRLRQLVGHLIADARPQKLSKHIAESKSDGINLNLNFLGEAVLGEEEANYRFEETFNLLRRPDVDYVSIKLSAVASQLSMWGFEQTVRRLVDKLTPLYEFAASQPTQKFINLDMEEYRDLGLTMLVFKKLLSKEQLQHLEAGIVLQAYLPDSFEALKELTDFAQTRTANGGAGIKVRIVKGANLAMEIVDAKWHGWELATYPTKAETDANYKRLIDYALDERRVRHLRVGIAGHNLFDLAFAHKLSVARKVTDGVEFEMLQGMAQQLSTQVRRSVGSLLLYTPVVRPSEFQVAVAYLTRRLEENGSSDNFMSGLFDITTDRDVFDRERMRFETSLRVMDNLSLAQNRTQNRLIDKTSRSTGFTNAPDTDPAIASNRDWIRQVLAAAKQLEGNLEAHQSHVARAAIETYELEELISSTKAAAGNWNSDTARRKELLIRAGSELANSRGSLMQLMIAEAGKTFAEADSELSEAVDFANFYAHSIDEIKTIEKADGVTFIPHQLVVVTPPWNFPVAIAAGGVLAALAAGAAVIIKPAPQVVNCVIALVETLWRAGIPKDVLRLALIPDNDLGLQLVGHTQVDSVILTGGYETAELFKNYRTRMQLAAETSGKNSIVITPFADLDLAANDLAKSAFGHAGQKCSAASLGVLVGSVYSNQQFLKQLVDCAKSMKVGYGSQADATIGPLIEPPSPKLLRALTTLDQGETWLLEPKQLDETGRLWQPGIKLGVQPGSFFHLTECFGPVLGLMEAENLAAALELQNATDYGLTAGIHSLDSTEISHWLDSIEAGNLYVNRGITGAIVKRQPFGGFKRSAVGFGLKAGGRNYLLQFGEFKDASPVAIQERLSSSSIEFLNKTKQLVAEDKQTWLQQACLSDEHWLRTLYEPEHLDGGDLEVEGNYQRYVRADNVLIRVSSNAAPEHLLRIVHAAEASKARYFLSIDPGFASVLGMKLDPWLKGIVGNRYVVEAEQVFNPVIIPGTRLILVGAKEPNISNLQKNPDLFVIPGDVTKSGRMTLLAFLREQSISITQHRFGAISSELVNIFKPLV